MFVPIRSFNSPEDAYIVRGLLASRGLDVRVQENGTNSIFPSLDDSDGATTLFVEEQEVSKAEEILAAHGE